MPSIRNDRDRLVSLLYGASVKREPSDATFRLCVSSLDGFGIKRITIRQVNSRGQRTCDRQLKWPPVK